MALARALHTVVLANERYVLRRLALQAALSSLAIAGLVSLDGGWWWLSLGLLVMFLAGAAQLIFFIVAWNRSPLEGPWRGLALGVRRRREQVLELHGVDGEVLLMPVPLAMLDQVLAAASAEGTPVVREEAERERLQAGSKRTERLRDVEALLPHVPDPALRSEVLGVLAQIRVRDPLAGLVALEEPVRELEIKLMAERTAQTDSPLRGPRVVFGSEITALLQTLRAVLSGPDVDADRAHDRRQ